MIRVSTHRGFAWLVTWRVGLLAGRDQLLERIVPLLYGISSFLLGLELKQTIISLISIKLLNIIPEA